jgi:hypothetical protein
MIRLLLLAFLAQVSRASTLTLEQGDEAFKQRADSSQAYRALDIYRTKWKESPADAGAGWRTGMACQFVGMRLEKDSEKKAALFEEGKTAALRAAEIDDNCAPCHFWAAINMALYGDTIGPIKVLFTLSTIRTHLNRTLELDPGYALAGSYRVLALIEWKLPGILGGDNDRALAYLKKAEEISPHEPLNSLFLARFFRDELNKPEAAQEIARPFLTLPEPSSEFLESREAYRELVDMAQVTKVSDAR